MVGGPLSPTDNPIVRSSEFSPEPISEPISELMSEPMSGPMSEPISDLRPDSPIKLPSFSIILETENLAQADMQGLGAALETLASQTPSPTQANEVLLIDSGDTPPELLEQICQRYPWLTLYPVPQGTEYYGAKMLGAEAATGEVVVYYDSDCLYEPTWLQTILASFHRSDVQIVAGETRTRGLGPYGTAMALTYIFPQYSGEQSLQPSSQYFLNNVAFRRDLLLQNPIPVDLPLYRGNCVVHAQQLVKAGHTIWRQPQARATHAPPNGLSHFFWRFLLIGYDYYWQTQLLPKQLSDELSNELAQPRSPEPEQSEPEQSKQEQSTQEPLARALSQNQERHDPTQGLNQKLGIFRDRLTKLLQTDWRHALFLPLSLPVMVVSALLIYVGHQITQRRPRYLVDLCNKLAIEL